MNKSDLKVFKAIVESGDYLTPEELVAIAPVAAKTVRTSRKRLLDRGLIRVEGDRPRHIRIFVAENAMSLLSSSEKIRLEQLTDESDEDQPVDTLSAYENALRAVVCSGPLDLAKINLSYSLLSLIARERDFTGTVTGDLGSGPRTAKQEILELLKKSPATPRQMRSALTHRLDSNVRLARSELLSAGLIVVKGSNRNAIYSLSGPAATAPPAVAPALSKELPPKETPSKQRLDYLCQFEEFRSKRNELSRAYYKKLPRSQILALRDELVVIRNRIEQHTSDSIASKLSPKMISKLKESIEHARS